MVTDTARERRASPRIRLGGRVEFRIPRWPTPSTLEAEVVDVSEGGAQLEVSEILFPGIEIEVVLRRGSGEGDPDTTRLGEVTWVDLSEPDSLRIGVGFKDLLDLSRLLMLELIEDGLLEEEFLVDSGMGPDPDAAAA